MGALFGARGGGRLPHATRRAFDSLGGDGYPTGNRVFAEMQTSGNQPYTHGGTMGQFGQELRREREGRGVSVDAVCAATKVSLRHVMALEEGRFQELPGGVFRKGILRSYLSAIGLDETTWMQRYVQALRETGEPSSSEQDWVEFAENVHRNRVHTGPPTGLRWLGVVLMLLGLLVCGWVTWRFVLRDRIAPTGTSVRPESPQTLPPVMAIGKMKS